MGAGRTLNININENLMAYVRWPVSATEEKKINSL